MSARSPTHEIFAVRKTADKSHWSKLGAAWLHDDGDGLTERVLRAIIFWIRQEDILSIMTYNSFS
jgi:hypothetical protein